MSSTIATTITWPANIATPPAGWDRLTDTDGSQPSGWFTVSHSGFRGAVKGYPACDDAPWDIPADVRYHDEDDDYAVLRCRFDLIYTTYLFPDIDTTAGPSTHSFGNLDFCGGWRHPVTAAHDGLREDDALLDRVLSGAKPTGLLVGSDADVEVWAAAGRTAGLEALVYRAHNARVWIAPARLGDRVSHRALRATWHAVAAGDPDRARGCSTSSTAAWSRPSPSTYSSSRSSAASGGSCRGGTRTATRAGSCWVRSSATRRRRPMPG